MVVAAGGVKAQFKRRAAAQAPGDHCPTLRRALWLSYGDRPGPCASGLAAAGVWEPSKLVIHSTFAGCKPMRPRHALGCGAEPA